MKLCLHDDFKEENKKTDEDSLLIYVCFAYPSATLTLVSSQKGHVARIVFSGLIYQTRKY